MHVRLAFVRRTRDILNWTPPTMSETEKERRRILFGEGPTQAGTPSAVGIRVRRERVRQEPEVHHERLEVGARAGGSKSGSRFIQVTLREPPATARGSAVFRGTSPCERERLWPPRRCLRPARCSAGWPPRTGCTPFWPQASNLIPQGAVSPGDPRPGHLTSPPAAVGRVLEAGTPG